MGSLPAGMFDAARGTGYSEYLIPPLGTGLAEGRRRDTVSSSREDPMYRFRDPKMTLSIAPLHGGRPYWEGYMCCGPGGGSSGSRRGIAWDPEPSRTNDIPRVLFLCRRNDARSQMADALLRHLTRGAAEVHSAGTDPTSVDPLAARVLADMGFDMSGQRTKDMKEFVGQSFDYVISLCDREREDCIRFPGDVRGMNWHFPDPALGSGTEEQRYRVLRQTADQLLTRLRYLLIFLERRRRQPTAAE